MKRVLCLYPNPAGFSGQRAATELVMHLLLEGDRTSWDFVELKMPGFPKAEVSPAEKIRYGIQLFGCYPRALGLALFRRRNIDCLYANLSQARFGLFREGIVLWIFRWLRPGTRLVVSLHGSVFQTWEKECLERSLLTNLIRHATTVTVLGPSQKKTLEEWGLSPDQILVVPNTCEIVALGEEELIAKHQTDETAVGAAEDPLRVLHLSTLMEPKGFPMVVEGWQRWVENRTDPTELVICGNFATSSFDERFSTLVEARRWIEGQVENSKGRMRWIEGARGEAKRKLFADAHVFVFPSTYPVEAQPLVLLEAMASGCAIIATQVGEIPYMVSRKEAWLLPCQPTAEDVVEALAALQDADLRLSLAKAARRRYLEMFSPRVYQNSWRALLGAVDEGR
ncbi:MAG: glycosyltransferase family 4 protein [Verrucomicrobiota bacterium]